MVKTPLYKIKGGVTTEPPKLSLAGVKLGLSRVANVLNPFANEPVRFMGGTKDVGASVRSVVRIGETALTVGTIGAVASGSTALKVAGVSTLKLSTPALGSVALGTVAAVGGGYIAGSLLSGKTTQGQTGTQSGTQTITPQQNPIQNIPQSGGSGSISGLDSIRGNYNTLTRYQIQEYPTYNYAQPYQTPTQTTTPEFGMGLEQGQQASSNDWLIPALIVGGLFFMSK